MKIAIVTDSFHPTRDGVVACIDVMTKVLSDAGLWIEVIAPDPGEKAQESGIHYFPSVRFKNYPGYFVPIFPSNKMEVIGGINPDVVHIQGIALMALKGIIAAHQLGIPVIVTFHTMVGDTMKYYSPVKLPQDLAEKAVWLYLRCLMRWVDAIVAPTESTARELRDHGIETKDIRVIPTPVDTNRFSPGADGRMVRERYHLEGKKVIICVGRVSFEKNIDMLVRSLKCLDENTVLMIVGKGPASDSLRKLANDLDLGDRVILTGFVPDEELVEHYAAADVTAIASKFETQCLSAIESMSCGIPTVCANARAFADYIRDGENGFLFEDSIDDCVKKLKEAFDCADFVRDNAVLTASQFSVESFVYQMTELYADVIEKKRGVKNV